MYRESTVTPWVGALLIVGAFVLIFGAWVIFPRELYRQESLYAAEAAEFSLRNSLVTAHETPIRNGYPIYPALTALLFRGGLPMEVALRLVTVFFIAAGAVLVYFSAATGNGRRAGLAGAAMYCTSLLMLDKGVDGAPESLSAFWLLAAQMCFFYFGLRKNKWNVAWAGSALLILAGYFTGGFLVLVLFIVPMFFFRRLIAGRAKYRNWGFFTALALIVLSCIGRLAVQWSFERTSAGTVFFHGFADPDYIGEFFLYWVRLPVRLLPWSVIAWIPFCAALQRIDGKPLFSKYLRTLVTVTAALLWLIPKTGSRELFYLLGNLSILCGVYYELGMRRFGEKLRKLAPLAEYAALVIVMMFIVGLFADEGLLSRFITLGNTMNFRNFPETTVAAVIGMAGVLAIGTALRLLRRELPIWILLLSLSAMSGIFSSVMLLRYRAQDTRRGDTGRYIRETLQADAGKKARDIRLYKSGIGDFYSELFYSGVRVTQLKSVDELPDSGPRVVYLLSDGFPQNPKWSWSNLLPEEYTYQKQRIMLWRGRRNFREKFPER